MLALDGYPLLLDSEQLKPAVGEVDYDSTFWSSMGGQPVLYSPAFGPGPGGKAQDYSPKGNNGTLNSGCSWDVMPSLGKAVLFDGVTGLIDYGAGVVDLTKPFMCWGWGYYIATVTGQSRFFVKDDGSHGFALGIGLSSHPRFYLRGTSSTLVDLTAATAVANAPFFIAGGWTGSQLKVYFATTGTSLVSATATGTGTPADNAVNLQSNGTQGGASRWKGYLGAGGILQIAPNDTIVASIYARPWAMFLRRQSVFGVNTAPGGQLLLLRRRAAA